MILREKSDTEDYKVKILSCFLYVPVAQLSAATFVELERTLTTKNVAIQYRKIEIRNVSMVSGKQEYHSENLFSSDVPCRIVICFVETKNKNGHYNLNPFDFKRSWEVTVSATNNAPISERERLLEQKLLDFEKQLAFFKSCVSLVQVDETQPTISSKRKGRGKTSSKGANEPSFLQRLGLGASEDTSSVHSENASTSGQSTRSNPPPYSVPSEVGATKTVYIKQVELLLNGAAVDQVSNNEVLPKIMYNIFKCS